MIQSLGEFWKEGLAISWTCPRCHKDNHLRIIDEANFFGDKCACELVGSPYARCSINILGHQITYLCPQDGIQQEVVKVKAANGKQNLLRPIHRK